MFKNWLERKTQEVSSINPDKVDVENISAFFGISNKFAKYLCEMAVNEGYFDKDGDYYILNEKEK